MLKNLVLSISLLLLLVGAKAQQIVTVVNPYKFQSWMTVRDSLRASIIGADSLLQFPVGSTAPSGTASLKGGNKKKPALYYDSTGHHLYLYTPNDSSWSILGEGGGGGGVTSVAISSTDFSISGSPITGSGTITLNVLNNAITNAKLRQSAGLSVIGRATNSTGNVADIQASTSNTFFGYNGTSLGFFKVDLTSGVTGILPVANGGTGTSTPGIVAGSGVSVAGTWPNQTVSATGGGGGGVNTGSLDTALRIGNESNRSVYLNKGADTGKVIYFFGNSIGEGAGITDPITQGYPAKVARFFGMTPRNLCQSGTTMQGNSFLISNIPVKRDSIRAIFIELVTNDILNENGTTRTYTGFITDYKKALDTIVARGWGSYMRDVHLIGPAYFSVFSTPLSKIQQYNTGVDSLHSVYGTSYRNMLNATIAYGNSIIPDLLHPDSTGNDIWTKALIDSFHYKGYVNGQQLLVNNTIEVEKMVARELKTGSVQTYPIGLDSNGNVAKLPYNALIFNVPTSATKRQLNTSINISGGVKGGYSIADGYINAGSSISFGGIDLSNMITNGGNLFYNGDVHLQGGVPFTNTKVLRLNGYGGKVTVGTNATGQSSDAVFYVDGITSVNGQILTGEVATSGTGFVGTLKTYGTPDIVQLYGFDRDMGGGTVAGNVIIGAASDYGGTSKVFLGQSVDTSSQAVIVGGDVKVKGQLKLVTTRIGISTDSVLVKGADSIIRAVAQSSIGGGITGSGTSGRVAYWNGTSSLTSGSNLTVDGNSNLSVGSAIPSVAPLYSTGSSTWVNGFQSAGANYYKVTSVTSSQTLTAATYIVIVDATSGNITVTLPTSTTAFAAGVGIQYVIKRVDSSGNTVTVQRGGSDTIDGGTSFTLSTNDSKTLQCVGGSPLAWVIISAIP